MAEIDIEDHAKHFIRKCIVATAIAVIKNKPSNINVKDYCFSIRSKIREAEKIKNINNLIQHDTEINAEEIVQDLDILIPTQQSTSCENSLKFDSQQIKKSSKLNLQIIHAVREVKNVINYKTSESHSASQESFCESFKDSGFLSDRSQKYMNEGYRVENKINEIDDSLNILINFLKIKPSDQSLNQLYEHISEILGTAFDILFEQNIHMPSINRCVEIIKEMIENILKTSDEHMKESWKNELKSFYSLNKSLVLIQQALYKLCEYLKESVSKLISCDKNEDFQSLEVLNNLSFVFILTDELLDNYNTEKKKRQKSASFTQKSAEPSSENFNGSILDRNWNLTSSKTTYSSNLEEFENFLSNTFNYATLECVESYPLFSFWAMECLNKTISKE